MPCQCFFAIIHTGGGIKLSENRLFKIIYYLLDKGQATARELSEKFEVSVRTIYRDLDRISGAGLPVYTVAGRGGGIRLHDRFVLNKSLLSEQEMQDIVTAVQSLSAVQYPDTEDILSKLRATFQLENSNWIEVDFSRWGSDEGQERQKFNHLKHALLKQLQIHFRYHNSSGQVSERDCQPLKLIYRDRAWYLYAHCLTRNAARLFRISRIKELQLTAIRFERPLTEEPSVFPAPCEMEELVNVELCFPRSAGYRVYDTFDDSAITPGETKLIVRAALPRNEWLYSFILSFGDQITIKSPLSLKTEIAKRLKTALAHIKEEDT